MYADPISYDEAVESQEWLDVMEEEIFSIEKNETWELVDLPEGKNFIGLKWIYRTNYHADGTI